MTRDGILVAAARFRGWSHGLWDPSRRRVECSSLVGDTVARGYLLGYQPDSRSQWWRDVSVWDPARPWSMLEALAKSPGGHVQQARHGPYQPTCGAWHALQGWEDLTGPDGAADPDHDAGHQVLWLASDTDPWVGWTLETRPGVGPCVGTAHGYVPLAAAIDAAGTPRDELEPMRWADRYARYRLVGWVELPPPPPVPSP